MTDSASVADPFGPIADEFVSAYRSGRRPSVEEFARRYPDFATEIREILPTLVLMERAKEDNSSLDGERRCEQDSALLLGRELGDYRIIREIGRGGMGVVYEAEQVSLGRRVAIKVLGSQVLASSKQRRRFDREARSAAKLHHTNIVPVFGVGEQDGLCYYVMQLIRGLGMDHVLVELKRMAQTSSIGAVTASREGIRVESSIPSAVNAVAQSLLSGQFSRLVEPDAADSSPLPSATNSGGMTAGAREQPPPSPEGSVRNGTPAVYVVADGALPGREDSTSSDRRRRAASSTTYWMSIARIGGQVGDALQYAHDHGITHRDVKPSNLLLDLHGTVWVTDFGLAKSDDQQNLTHSGDVLGTIRYLPPEAFEGTSDARSDVYSLGLTLYELLTLRPAFDDMDRRALVKKVTHGDPPRVDRLIPEIPRDLATVVHKAIERDPRDRYQSAKDLAEDLRRFERDEPVLARRASWTEQVRRWSRRNRSLAGAFVGIASLLAIITCGAVLAAVYYRFQQEREQRLHEAARILAQRNERLADENRQALDSAIETSRQLDAALADSERQRQTTRQLLYYAQMAVAHQSRRGHRGVLRSQTILDAWRPREQEPDLRGWEWYYIQALCHGEWQVLSGHQDAILSVAYSPSGKWLASTGRDGTVRIWLENQPLPIAIFPHPQGAVHGLAWDPSGLRLAVAGVGGVTLWDVGSRRKVLEIPSAKPAYSVCFSPDGQALAWGAVQAPLEVWDTVTWTRSKLLPGHQVDIYTQTISFHPNNQWLAAPAGNAAMIFDVKAGRVLRRFAGHSAPVIAAVFSPDGSQLATTSRDATVRLWDPQDGRLIDSLEGHTHGIASAAFHPQGNLLATAAWDGSCRLWDLRRRTELGQPRGHARHAFSVSWHPSGSHFASGGDDNLVKLWRDAPPQAAIPVREPILSFTLDAARKQAVWSTATGTVWYGNGELPSPAKRLDLRLGPLANLEFHPQGSSLLLATTRGQLYRCEPETGDCTRLLPEQELRVMSLDWHPAGKEFVTGGTDGAVTTWDAVTGQRLQHLPKHHSGGVSCVRFSDNGRWLASAGAGGLWKCWDATTGQTREFPGHTAWLADISFSPDGQFAVTGGTDHTARLWNLSTGEQVALLSGHREVILAVDFSPDGQRILTADSRGTIKLWDAASGLETLTLQGAIGSQLSARWSPDGQRIVANSDGRLQIWDASRGYALERPAWTPTSPPYPTVAH